MAKYTFIEREPVGDSPVGHRVLSFLLLTPGQPEWAGVGLTWHEDIKRPFCSQCSSPLAAESSSCVHAQALRRHMKRASQMNKERTDD